MLAVMANVRLRLMSATRAAVQERENNSSIFFGSIDVSAMTATPSRKAQDLLIAIGTIDIDYVKHYAPYEIQP
jgi:hypothetical protein